MTHVHDASQLKKIMSCNTNHESYPRIFLESIYGAKSINLQLQDVTLLEVWDFRVAYERELKRF